MKQHRPKITIAELLRQEGRWPLPKGRLIGQFTFARPVQVLAHDKMIATFTYTLPDEKKEGERYCKGGFGL